MSTVFHYLYDYFVRHNKWHLLLVTVFTGIAIALNYHFDIEDGLIDRHYGRLKHFWLYFLLYAVSTVPVYLSYAYEKEAREGFLVSPRFWGRLTFMLAVFSFYCYFFQYRDWMVSGFDNYYRKVFFRMCADQVVQAGLMFIMIVLFWLWRDRKEQRLYGMRVKGVDLKPYLWMLVLMAPLIIGAAFFSSFTDYYPTARKLFFMKDELHPFWLYILGYELAYGSEFFHIEFFFRGFIILGLVKYGGYRVILPAAVFYCFVHFGKPMGECISSYFGGIILGILSYRTKSVAAGVMVHLGIAWMMEAVAGVWYLVGQ